MTSRDAGADESAEAGARATAWISRGFEELLYELGKDRGDRGAERAAPYDVVVVGSGYGGAIAARELAGCRDAGNGGHRVRVCVLERGVEYLPGTFPSRMADLAGHVRFSTPGAARARGNREGLFDLRVGADLCALVANGLGGGSLINAGVLEKPRPDVFDGWPAQARSALVDGDFFARAKQLLGAADAAGRDNTIERHPDGPPAKFRALQRLGAGLRGTAGSFRAAAISISVRQGKNPAGVALESCTRCGDCMTGCNHGAKQSLDVNLLAEAWSRGAELFTGATVLRIERDAPRDAWLLDVVHTDDKLRSRQGAPLQLAARKVVLAAGCFGSTEILLRSQSDTLKCSRRLGQRLSSNGDMIATAYAQQMEVNAVADEAVPPAERAVGPTITGIIDLRREGMRGHAIEELAIPAPLARVFEELATTAHVLHGLTRPDLSQHAPGSAEHDPCAIDGDAIRRSSVFAVMGHDGGDGSLELIGGGADGEGDGALRVRWPALRERSLFGEQLEVLRELAAASDAGGQVLPNPLWQALPQELQFLFGSQRGPLLTVHPLGGCPMGDDAGRGAVNHRGEVFDASQGERSARVHPGLVVLDGSIVPTSLGINPALTIAATALQAVEALRREWRFEQDGEARKALPARPHFRKLPPPREARPTQVEFVERMSGTARLAARDGRPVECAIELTLKCHPLPLGGLVRPAPGARRPLTRTLDVKEGQLRVFRAERWREWRDAGGSEQRGDELAEFSAPLTGSLYLLHREASQAGQRRRRARFAFFLNRGLRDGWQAFRNRCRRDGLAAALRELLEMARRLPTLNAVATHAGEVRLIEYELELGESDGGRQDASLDTRQFAPRRRIRGGKRLTYDRRSNPWRQLMRLTLHEFPALAGGRAQLELDAKHLADIGVPLLHIVDQQDQPSAIADVASFLAYFARLLVAIHGLSFRAPDTPRPRTPQRLPGTLRGLPDPEIKEIELERLADGTPVRVRLTRYRPPKCLAPGDAPPVVMIHGYSASGTTFAHPAVRPNLAGHFCGLRRDVWILDLRTSCGMPTARRPWKFEDAALADLPAAFDHIRRATGSGQIDVVAHCVGAAMFSMAVLAPPAPGEPFHAEREALPHWIRKAVLSQVGPAVEMTAANIFRAYAMSYLRHFLPFAEFEFRVRQDPGLIDQLIDRLLATQPYPQEEFDIENPLLRFWRRTPFAGTRHRMDALYGRDFNLAGRGGRVLLDDKVLEYIDDLFGPLSLETVSQAIHLARLGVVTDRDGSNEYLLRRNLLTRWIFPTLSVHGRQNGLFDIATLARLEEVFRHVPRAQFRARPLDDFGHQDCLIGRRAGEVFEVMSEFLA